MDRFPAQLTPLTGCLALLLAMASPLPAAEMVPLRVEPFQDPRQQLLSPQLQLA